MLFDDNGYSIRFTGKTPVNALLNATKSCFECFSEKEPLKFQTTKPLCSVAPCSKCEGQTDDDSAL